MRWQRAEADADPEAAAEAAAAGIPSNDGCPKTPLRDPEVQLFLRQLKRMSFKRESKSFTLILRKHGFNADGESIAPPPPPEEDDDAPPF